MNELTTTEKQKHLAKRSKQFKDAVSKIATTLLVNWVGEERAGEATGRIASAMTSAAMSARNPEALYSCTTTSVASCIALAALTGIMPGTGSTALAYLVPQPPRKDEPPQLEYNLSHRGLNVLARRCGQTMIPIPVGHEDNLRFDGDGVVFLAERDIDNPPTTYDELRGVLVIVKELSTGVVIDRCWMPKKLIDKRRAMSRSLSGAGAKYSPWTKWPVEMSMKTAMHYTIARGICVIDDTSAARALNADVQSDLIIEARGEARETRADQVAAALGVDSDAGPAQEPAVDTNAEAEESQEVDPEKFRQSIANAGDEETLTALVEEVDFLNSKKLLDLQTVIGLRKLAKDRGKELRGEPVDEVKPENQPSQGKLI